MSERHEAVANYLSYCPAKYRLGMIPVDEIIDLTRACDPIATLPPSLGTHVASMHLEVLHSLSLQGQYDKGRTVSLSIEKARSAADKADTPTEPMPRRIEASLLRDSVDIYAASLGMRFVRLDTEDLLKWQRSIRLNLQAAYDGFDPEQDGADLPFMQRMAVLGLMHHGIDSEKAPYFVPAPTRFTAAEDAALRYGLHRIEHGTNLSTRHPVRVGTQRHMHQLVVVPAWLRNDEYPDKKKGLGTIKAVLDHNLDVSRRAKRSQKGGPITKPKPAHPATVHVAGVANELSGHFERQIIENREFFTQQEQIGDTLPENWYESLGPLAEPLCTQQGETFLDQTISNEMITYLEGKSGLGEAHQMAWMYIERALGNVRWQTEGAGSAVEDINTAADLFRSIINPQKGQPKFEITESQKFTVCFDEITANFYSSLVSHPDTIFEATVSFQDDAKALAEQVLGYYDNLDKSSSSDVPKLDIAKTEEILHLLSLVILTPPEMGITVLASKRQRESEHPLYWDMTTYVDDGGGYKLSQRRRLRTLQLPGTDAFSSDIATVDRELICQVGDAAPDFAPLRHALGQISAPERYDTAQDKLVRAIDAVQPA